MTSSRFVCWPAVSDSRSGLGNPRFGEKKGAPACAGAPQRSGHCRVCAQTEVQGATLERRAGGELHIVSALAVAGDIETLAFLLDGGTQTYEHVDELVEDCRTDAGPEQGRQHGLALRDHL